MRESIIDMRGQAAVDAAELQRLDVLYNFESLDTPVEPEYNTVVVQAAAICEIPISLITLITEG